MNLTGQLPRPKGARLTVAAKPSAPIRKAARGETCTLRLDGCLPSTETVVLAHLRHFGWAGTSQKPDDLLAVFACHACHDALDRRTHTPCGYDDILRALGETLLRHKAAGRLTVGGQVERR